MARTNRESATDGRRLAAARRNNVPDAPAAGVVESEQLRATVDAAFRDDEVIADAIKSNLKARTVAAESIARRVEKAFTEFSPSAYSKEERARPTYLAPGDKLDKLLEGAAKTGAKELRKADRNSGIRLTRGPALDKLIKNGPDDGASVIGKIRHKDLVKYVTQGLEAGASPVPSLRVCDAEAEAERRLSEIDNPATSPATPSSGNGSSPTDPTEDGHPSTGALVKSTVNELMDTLVPPEAEVRLEPPARADDEAIAKSIDTFELRDGPSDVTSYHDFNSLQIAFPHIWTEVFDGELESLGKELYKEYVRLKEFAGVDDADDKIGTVADLGRLIGQVEALSRLTQDQMPGGSGGGVGTRDVPSGGNDLRDEFWYKLATGSFIGNDAVEMLANPAGFAIGFLGDLLANMQQITWELLEEGNRLPGGIDIITAKVEPNAIPAGRVEIVLKTLDSTATWKGLDFYENDSSGRPLDVIKISNHPHDTDTMQPRTAQVKNGMLAFGKEITFGARKAHYFLIDLDEKLKDRTRVTFTWEKDK